MAADAASAVVLVFLVSALRFGPDWGGAWASSGGPFGAFVVTYALAWTSVVWFVGLYRLRVRWTASREAFDILRSGVLFGFAIFGALFALKLPEVSRLFLVMLLAGQVVTTFLMRLALRAILIGLRASGRGTHYMLVVGTGTAARRFAVRVGRRRELGLRVIGFVASQTEDRNAPGVIGRVEDLHEILHSRVVDEVAICLPPEWASLVEAVARTCEEEGRIVRIPLVDGAPQLPGGAVEDFDGTPLQSLVYGPDRAVALMLKRLMDIVGALAGIVLLSPVVVVVTLAIWIRDGRPIYFRQPRVGVHGRIFHVAKFRTMILDAEARLDDLQALNEIQGHAFKITNDPRMTRTGVFLRRTSLDELPQLWNVLRGDMSLVGPRPPLPREVDSYDLWHRRRLSMKPGITGLWQVSARREEDFDRWVALDLAYIDGWSLLLDLRILAATIPAVVLSSGR
jgi:exopolysaccharide biosynthesis polyprenyl glycosylphosphotransferase